MIVFNSSQSKLNVNYPPNIDFYYRLDCSPFLFSSDLKRNQTCAPDPETGYLEIASTDTDFAYAQPYRFTYTMSSLVLNYTSRQTVNASFFNDFYYSCPSMRLEASTQYSKSDDRFLIVPALRISCKGT